MTAFNITASLPHSFTEFLCSLGWLWILASTSQVLWIHVYHQAWLSLQHQCLMCGPVTADGHHNPQWAIPVFPLAWSFLVLTLVAYSFLVNYFEILKKYSFISPLFNIGDLVDYKCLGWKFYLSNFESTEHWMMVCLSSLQCNCFKAYKYVTCFILHRNMADSFPVFCDSQESP